MRPGSRGLLAAGLVVLAGAVVASALMLSASGGAGASNTAAGGRYGQIPSWLPQPKVAVGRLVSPSAAHPWVAIEGDTVAVDLARGRVTVTTVGPAVPQEGAFPVPATSPCTFTVTFTAASGTVPLNTRECTILDELSHLHRPHVAVAGGGALPRFVTAGRTVTVSVRDVLPTGGGQLRWAPERPEPIVSWDFDVEID